MARLRDYTPLDKPLIHELQRAQYTRWFGDPDHGVLAEPDAVPPEYTVIVEDEGGMVIGALGARPVVEIGTVLDLDHFGPRHRRKELLQVAMRAWARLASRLHRGDAQEAVCVVGPHIKGWANLLTKRFGWKPEPFAMYRFDIKGEFDELRK